MKSLTWRRRGVESMLIALFGNRGRALLGQGRRRLGRGGRLKGGCSKGSEAVVGWVGVELGRGLHKALIFTRLSQDFDKVSTKGWTPCHVAAYLIRDPRHPISLISRPGKAHHKAEPPARHKPRLHRNLPDKMELDWR